MNNKTTLRLAALSLALAAATTAGGALAADEAVIDKAFQPYKTEKPSFNGLSAGMTINKGNVAQFKEILDPAFYGFIEKGWAELKVGETTSFDLPASYVDATRQYMDNVKLGAKPGEISGAVAGRPFPQEPDASDPRAGEKLAWNFKYGYNWGDSAAISPFYWKFRDMNSGKVERTIKFDFHFLNFTRRVDQEPKPAITPNPSQLFRGIYVKAQEPYDVRNTQLLIHRAEDDLKRDNSWLYLGFQRRVRRLATGQVTDAFLGSDLMIEDFEGYNGRISDMQWTYKGTRFMLMPFYNHNELALDSETHKDSDGYQVVAFGGQGGCFPNITWQLRKVYEVESVPVEASHPLSKRVHYMDAQTFAVSRTISYDRKGAQWKTFTIGKAHPDHHLPKNKGTGVALDDSFSMIDVQAMHCTSGQFKGQVDPDMSKPEMFSVQHMRATGN
ncbi:DUF1329 domain-containing protein [Pseudomonas aeruginosa]|uniref:Protein of uncharacterized function (DUF1329) n=1 Tax=Pseudomonas fluorescens TaxID=294 RepID=A0A3S4MPV5_PSEFL|nr:DUF1329 domain-containing protein [Pseudomonas aeruginosa]MBG7207484.1 DUF1329 domain-containing protein [Pseudomonas aeruginosa]MBV6253767.1 DUF1329 domain-containing protein [Pseudomonas aeruginosa]VEE46160.1 Protein of uncharacterised function (DUF1329) [Pseudomonas fluorescens]HBN9751043.1 DUF1329 domain-containing protein [Pseudomonas aeruginosa]